MQVARHTVVSIDYTLTNDEGEVIDTSKGAEPLSYIHGTGQIVPGLEAAMTGRGVGDSFRIRIEASEGYGERDPDLVQAAKPSQFGGETPEVGMQVRADGPDGAQIFTIVGVEGDRVTLDGNHPLAGMPLTFDVAIVGVRAATAQEVQHGHAHGDHGKDH
ncbi:MAG TPA: peptidylprolyl isomerase [Candidatus Eisenbacteria bacterium]|nr:peptidylprolyl isomerase [Candidatus Eisenbacteria bacterium]